MIGGERRLVIALASCWFPRDSLSDDFLPYAVVWLADAVGGGEAVVVR